MQDIQNWTARTGRKNKGQINEECRNRNTRRGQSGQDTKDKTQSGRTSRTKQPGLGSQDRTAITTLTGKENQDRIG